MMFIKACSYLNKGTQANRSIRSVAKIVKYTKTISLLLPLRLKKKDVSESPTMSKDLSRL